jgi:hypothetical protein
MGITFQVMPMLFIVSFTLGVDVHIAEDFDLAGQAHVGILFAVAAQPEFFHEGQRIGILSRGNSDAVSTTEAIAMTVGKLPETTVNGNIVFQCRVAHRIPFRDVYLHFFAYIDDRWHELYPPKYSNMKKAV